jgi:hypothetical protein
MPTHAGPNTFGEENLVFGYDLGDINNSYKGEPTVNQYANPDFSNGTSGWTFGSWDGARYTYTTETVIGPFGEPVSALKVVRTTSDTSFAHFHQGNGGKYVNGSTYTMSAYVKGSGTLRKLTQSGFSGNTGNETLTGEWKRVTYTVLSSTNTAYPYWGAELITQNVPMYFVFAQSEAKPQMTSYVNGSRTSTQGLLDLVNNSAINLANVSFDSNSQMTFDGTNDYIDLGSYLPGINTSILSIELVFKSNSITTGANVLLGWMANEYPHGYICTGNFTGHWSNESIAFYNEGPGTTPLSFAYTNGSGLLNDTNYHHAVFILQTNGYKIYIDGSEVTVNPSFRNGSMSTTMPSNLFGYGSTASVEVGAGSSPASYSNIKVPIVKIYNRILTAAEVQSNYTAIKSRFNI